MSLVRNRSPTRKDRMAMKIATGTRLLEAVIVGVCCFRGDGCVAVQCGCLVVGGGEW
jgi:hypothetical protein